MSLAETLSTITRLSVGTNPRSLKRLTNTLALISIIYDEQYGEKSNVTTLDKLINFALVCVQIAYPYIYNQLTEEPDFKSWNEKIASKLKLRPLTELERESLDSTEEFDEDWEKVLFRMCQMETYLSNRAFSISGLLNKIAQIIGNDEQLGEIIESILEMSAVTNIKAFDAPKRVKVSEIQWAEKLWNPVKEQLSQSLNIKMSIPKDKGYSHISSEAIKGAIYTFSYSVKSGVAAVSLETFGGEEIKRVVEQKIATAPADHPLRSAVVSQGKKNKNKWNWSIQINIDKYDPTLIQWYVDTVLSMYTLLEK
jgi:hypothetical protein